MLRSRCLMLCLLILASFGIDCALADDVSPLITVNQFGWLPRSRKIAILADPVRGQNAGQSFQPGPEFVVRQQTDSKIVYRGKLKPWNGGRVSELAGDRVWYAEFSDVRAPGTYQLYDPTNRLRSYPFRIADDVYKAVLRDSVRTFYYQRSGTPITEKHGGKWHHRGGHLGPAQDRAANYSQNGKALGQPRDLLGGWFDAGDLNKYVPYLEATLFDLLWAYELNPGVFGDNTNVPESGNGVPDLLDEVKWELDWLLKMQDDDGGVFNRVAGRSHDNGPDSPVSDKQARFYTAKTTWATATAVASFAHAARVYERFDRAFPGYAARLIAAAKRGWTYLESHPEMDPADGTDGDKTLAATPASSNRNGDRRSRVYAAAELFKTVGEHSFKAYVDRWATDVAATAENGLHPFGGGKQVDPLNHVALTQALFVYATTKNASPNVTAPFKDALRAYGRVDPCRHGRARRSLPGLSSGRPLLLGQQSVQGAMGAHPAHDDCAQEECARAPSLSRDRRRLLALYSRAQPPFSLLSDQHGPSRGRPLRHGDFPLLVS